MTRLDAPFTVFRFWWRGASNGRRSRTVAAGTATVAFLIWIGVPSGGGLLPSFAAGFPTSATSQLANAATPPAGQGPQLAPNALGLEAPAMASPGAAGITGGTSAGSPADIAGGGSGESPTPDIGAGPSTTGPEPGPTAPGSSCPASFPPTSTPLDGLAAQLTALCAQVLGGGSGTVPAASLPGGSSGAGASQVPRRWMYLDAPAGASGPVPNANLGLSALLAGKSPTVPVGLVEGSPVSPAMAGALDDLVRHGVLVQLVLVPTPGAAGGAPAFASWVSQVLAAIGPVPLVEMGVGGAPPGASAATVASDTVAGLAAAHDAPGPPTAGVLWLDGGTTGTDAAVWSALEHAGAWSTSSFVARALDAAGSCTSPAGFAATLRRSPTAGALPVVAEAVQAPAPVAWIAADYGCLRGSVAQGPPASVAMWRLWEGPVPR